MRGVKETVIKGKKTCTRCGIVKPLESFYKSKVNSGGRRPYCKECQAVIKNAFRHKDIEKTREKERIVKRRYKDKERARGLRRRHGLSTEIYEAMFIRQLGVCAICSKEPEGITNLCVDHNHKTSEIRGLLCNWCNLIVGWVEKDPRYVYALGSDRLLEYAKNWGIL